MTSGTLYIVPTPIGNLDDFSARSVSILKEVTLILAEDTRTSGKLLKHFDVKTPAKSFHAFNEHQKSEDYINLLLEGRHLALISDAGTPGISDPGYLLVKQAIDHEINIITIPGPTAFVPALVNSGFPMDRFVFEGFLPHKKGRQTRWKSLVEEERTMIFYESPHRINRFLDELKKYFGEDRQVSISREISKIYEETLRGTPFELLDTFHHHPPKGEIVVVVAGYKKK